MASDNPPPPEGPEPLDPAGAVRYRPAAPSPRVAEPPPPPPDHDEAPPGPRRAKKRRWWPLAALLAAAAALAGLGIGAALWSGDEPEERRPAAATSTEPAPQPEPATTPTQAPTPPAARRPAGRPARRPVRVRFKRLRGGLRGRGEVTLARQGKGSALMQVTARFRSAAFAVYLVNNGRLRKRLASARGGRLRYRTPVAVRALARRYDGIVVVAQRLPNGRRARRSLRVNTATLVRRLARRRAGR